MLLNYISGEISESAALKQRLALWHIIKLEWKVLEILNKHNLGPFIAVSYATGNHGVQEQEGTLVTQLKSLCHRCTMCFIQAQVFCFK